MTTSPIDVLVCGGRYFADKDLMWATLDQMHSTRPFKSVIHGAARGADTMAGVWAAMRDITVRSFAANWARDGGAAGHIRNRRMLIEGCPGLVVAFKGGAGTLNMVAQADKAGVRVVKVGWDE